VTALRNRSPRETLAIILYYENSKLKKKGKKSRIQQVHEVDIPVRYANLRGIINRWLGAESVGGAVNRWRSKSVVQ
jgi:hypothetical protein